MEKTNEIIEYLKERYRITPETCKIILAFLFVLCVFVGLMILAAYFSGSLEPRTCLSEDAFRALIK